MRSLLVRAGLRFADAADERAFLHSYVLRHRTAIQLLMVGSAILNYLFLFSDRSLNPARAEAAQNIRGLVLLVIAGLAAALWLKPVLRRLEVVLLVGLAVVEAGLIAVVRTLEVGVEITGGGLLLIIIVAVCLFPMRYGYFLAVSLVTLAANAAALAQSDSAFGVELVNGVAVVAALVIGSVAVIRREHLARAQWRMTTELATARDRIQHLLLSMLPQEIVERIQAGETGIADTYGEVSIVFADLVGFTSLSRRLSPRHLVELLNRFFSVFDEMAAAHGMERIKTIGDAYMAVGGLQRAAGSDHAGNAARFALAVQAAVDGLDAELELPLKVRMGLHIGPVVAGVVGAQRPAFDCWGEAVNLASRLEGAAQPGSIAISETAYWRLKPHFATSALGEVELKGLGPTPIFRLERAPPDPPPAARARPRRARAGS